MQQLPFNFAWSVDDYTTLFLAKIIMRTQIARLWTFKECGIRSGFGLWDQIAAENSFPNKEDRTLLALNRYGQYLKRNSGAGSDRFEPALKWRVHAITPGRREAFLSRGRIHLKIVQLFSYLEKSWKSDGTVDFALDS